jgi:glyoxylase-like metal-dependent hydrolase (beta-lactamase superfamily II)
MKIETVVVGPLQTNCYLLWDKTQTVIIDPGAEPEKIFSLIASPVKKIIATHAHPDHVGAVWAMKHEFPQAKFLLHQADLPILKDAVEGAQSVLNWQIPEPPLPDEFLKEGQRILISNSQFSVLHTPGHSPGSVCLLGKDCLFSGDVLFAHGYGRTDFPLGDKQEMKQSLKRLAQLPKELIIYPGHEEAVSLGQSLEWLRAPLGVW